MRNPLHVAIIMDGNGRWALGRGLPRVAGHRAGADAVRRVVEAAPDLGIGVLTLFAFSADNWRRPAVEVAALMKLFAEFLKAETARCIENGVRLEVIGRRDRLEESLCCAVARAEALTANGSRLTLRIAVDYSAREAILAAARELTNLSGETLGGVLGPAVDLLIRTGGERRLSDFLLWESAYAELVFSRRMWPDFDADDLAGAVREFHGRERRYGGVPVTAVAREAWLD
ncbi:MAG TPA: di-trans,poly-cis-decaprenylcistransferase [Bryobacteraceae bacterium]|nr:di-trans,poly-cis-decaprenylcistransferase [Bryobacteraceae bacterium]